MVSERREFARLLRSQATKAEEILWRRLRGSRFDDAKFRRQVPFDRFIVDFYCHAAKLAVGSTASSTNGSPTTTRNGRAFWRRGDSASLLRQRRGRGRSGLRAGADTRGVTVAHPIEARGPHPCPSPERERGSRASEGRADVFLEVGEPILNSPCDAGTHRMVGPRRAQASAVLRPTRGGRNDDLPRRSEGRLPPRLAIPLDEPSADRRADGFKAFRRHACKMAT